MSLLIQAPARKRGFAPWLVVVAVATVAVLLLGRQQRSAAADRELLEKRIAQLEQRLQHYRGRTSENLDRIRGEVDEKMLGAEDSAKAEVRRNSERLAGFVTSRQREQQEMFLQELGSARDAVKRNELELAQVQTTVAGFRGDVAAIDARVSAAAETVGAMQQGVADLKGEVEGAASRLAEIRRRSERKLTPFRLGRTKQLVRLGDVQVRLKDANPHRNRYTIELLADDRLVTHKNQPLFDSIEIYSFDGDHREIVVTGIEKDRVEGYLATPQTLEFAGSSTTP